MTAHKDLFTPERLLIVFVLFCLLAYLSVFLLMNFQGYAFFNSDSYADSQVARQMWTQRSLFPEGWRFGNQYYVVATPVLAALIYGITGNSFTAMAIATEIMTIFIVISFCWMLRPVTKNMLSQMFCCLLLVASVIAPWGPYSINSMLFYTQASFYACYLITLFVVFGDYIRTLQTNRKRPGAWLLALLLCFATGMQSLRQTVITILPIAAYEILRAFRSLVKCEPIQAKENPASILRSASYAAANLAGILTIEWLNIPQATIYGGDNTVSRISVSERIQAAVTAVGEISSLDYVLSGDCSRLIALVIIYMVLLVLVAAAIWFFRIHKQETSLELYWILCVIGIFGVLLATILLNITLRAIYIFMWFPLVAFSGLLIAEKMHRPVKYGFIAMTCILSLASLVYCYAPYVQIIFSNEASDAQRLSHWAVDNGYEYIYGEYWGTAPQIAVYSQDQLEAGCWHTPDSVFQTTSSNTPQNIYGAEENNSALYVFSEEDEGAGLTAAQKRGIQLTKVVEFGKYRGYIASSPLMELS